MAILTISRQYGSGGRELGLAVAAQLGYAYLDQDAILADIRKEYNRIEEEAKKLAGDIPLASKLHYHA